MLISGKGRYAITAMMNLAMNDKQGPLSLADISQTQGISLSYLEQIFARLRKKGLVRGTRGRRGGYRLGRTAEAISMGDIVRAVEELETADESGFSLHQIEPEESLVDPYWKNLQGQLYGFLDKTSLAVSVAEAQIPSHLLAGMQAPTAQRDKLKYS
ncbi:MAG: Rrf2 family transcriptional regulator iron-sulfur cluster assembly transcription factor [Halothiobacillaceae bacterium]|nr:MAG: Rrf2 family transcriptional regulator iron-sulfur cluster assembly transcription factor [Halothiobacillaceae bacterium]